MEVVTCVKLKTTIFIWNWSQSPRELETGTYIISIIRPTYISGSLKLSICERAYFLSGIQTTAMKTVIVRIYSLAIIKYRQ